jgi:thioesterase domain-containing protein/acyl carrier protein
VVRLVWQPSYVELTPRQRVAHFAPLAFDASTFEIWGPLLNGGTCVLIPDEGWELRDLEQHFRQHEVDTVWLTASLFNTVITECPEMLRPVRQLLTGGEVLSVPHIRRARKLLGGDVRLINGYGPTEDTTFACCHEITDSDLARDAALPIGRPINHTQLLVLDERLKLVPPGVAGELYLGGAGLARGYQGRPDWTAERFLADSTRLSPAGRIYRTGDLARWNHHGVLEFVGRADQQVKLRGHRIEPAEIEAALLTLPGVAEAVALVVGQASHGLQRLVAHVTAAEGRTLDVSVLQHLLRERLPEYLIPSAIVTHSVLPRTANGKLDRRALEDVDPPAWESTRDTAGRAPQTPTEQVLARLWCELLSREVVDCETSFFTLGGHSLLAVRLFHRIERELGVRLPLESLFHTPTIRGLAERIDGGGLSASAARSTPELIVPLRAGERGRPPLFLLPSATGNILFWKHLVPHLPEGVPVLAVVPRRNAQGDPVWDSVARAVAPLCDAVQQSSPTGPLQLLGYSAGAYLAQELARQLEERGREVGFLGLIDTGPAGSQPGEFAGWRGLAGFTRNLGYWLMDNNHRTSWRNLRRRWDRFRKRLWRRSSGPPVRGRFRTLEQNFQEMVARHQARPVQVRLTLLRARCQSPWHYRGDSLGWTNAGCQAEVVQIAGVDHFDIVAERHVPRLAAEIAPRLAGERGPETHGTCSPGL